MEKAFFAFTIRDRVKKVLWCVEVYTANVRTRV